jgi:hypothetical protein
MNREMVVTELSIDDQPTHNPEWKDIEAAIRWLEGETVSAVALTTASESPQ